MDKNILFLIYQELLVTLEASVTFRDKIKQELFGLMLLETEVFEGIFSNHTYFQMSESNWFFSDFSKLSRH